ncbi:MAG: hypothetical protein KC619_02790, partial [Myxococcales bacterium]|nr:hypothetical protein [Myxococcales bacterium]
PEPEPEPEPVPEPVAPVAAPVAPAVPAVDPELRIKALKVVAEAFETTRYLDFDAIVEKPSTYRVTVPITAANGPAVRFLEAGMFACLKKIEIEGSNAKLYIDSSKGPP